MRGYIESEILKEKREKHSYLGVICLLSLLLIIFSNAYKLTSNASVLDLYCDNMGMHFFITLFFSSIYTILLFADEYKYGTIYQLEIIPASPEKIIFAKMFIVMIFNIMVMFLITFICVGVIAFKKFDLMMYYIGVLLLINLVDAILLSLVMVPIVLFALLGKGNYIISLLMSIGYIIFCLVIPSFSMSQNLTQKLIAYGHPLGSYALIHNWLIYKFVPYETAMLVRPKESGVLALIGLIVWSVICFMLSIIMMRKKGK